MVLYRCSLMTDIFKGAIFMKISEIFSICEPTITVSIHCLATGTIREFKTPTEPDFYILQALDLSEISSFSFVDDVATFKVADFETILEGFSFEDYPEDFDENDPCDDCPDRFECMSLLEHLS